MPTHLLTYLLEANTCLIVFYLFYRVLLQKERCFMWNRIFLCGAVIVSLALPLIDIPLSPEMRYLPKPSDLPALTIFVAGEENNTQATEATPVAKNQEQTADPAKYLWAAYLGVSLLMFGKLLWQVSKLLYFGYIHTKSRYSAYTLVYTRGILPTCSFFHLLFWDNSQSLSEDTRALILTHELAHIRQWHSADAMLMELLKVICWFNPVVYLYKKALEEVHEYLADAAVTRQHDTRRYSQVMVEQVFKTMNFAFTQSFNRSLINKRIAMIQINKRTKPALWKMALSFPLMAILFFVYSCRTSEVVPTETAKATSREMYRMGEVVVVGYGPVVKDANEAFKKYNLPVPLHKSEEEAYLRVDKAPTPVNGMEEFRKEIQQAIRSKAAGTVNGTVHVQAIVDASGNIRNPRVLFGIDEEYNLLVVEAIKNSPPWNPGKVKDTPVNTRIVIPVVLGKPSTTYSTLAEVRQLSLKPGAGEPMPQEGMEILYKHIQKNIKYPQEARSALIEGQVVIGFTIRTDGMLADIQIEESVFPSLDAEVIRVIENSNLRWKPAMENGQARESRIVLPVTFKMS